MLKRLKPPLVAIAAVLLLLGLSYAGLGVESAKANTSSYQALSYLVVITYDDWDDLERLAPLRLNVLDRQVDRLVVIVSAQELATLRSLGFEVRILDDPAAPEQYYLVSLPPTGDAASLYRHGRVFSYVAGAFILKAEASEAELLSGEGFFIQKLLGPIVWPSSPSSGAVAAPDAYIQEYSPLIQNLINAVSQTQIYTSVLNLQDDDATPGWDVGRSRYSHAPELSVERDYIYSRLQALGLDVRYQGFSLSGTPLDNVEGTLNGWGPGSQVVYIVCAHYDSTSNDAYDAAPGADDNASGTAGVLEAARVLSQYRFKHTLRFVTFAGEEQGLIGSYYYAREARSTGTAIGGVLNLDMIAWDSNDDRVMELHAGTRGDSQTLGLAFQDANSTYGIGLAPQFITSGATTLSDHASFWNRDYPAILVIEDFQDFNPYYHNTSDTADKLNMPYATQLVQATVATLAELAEIIPPGIKVEHIGPTMAMAGEPIALVVQYANPSPTIATDVVISDTFSPGLTYFGENSGFPVTQPSSGSLVWQVGDMPPYGRSSFVVTASVGAGLPEGTQLTSTLSITGVTGWDDPEDNQAVWVGEVPWVYYLPVAFKEGD